MHELRTDLAKQKKEVDKKAQENTQGVAMVSKKVEGLLADGIKKVEEAATAATERQNAVIAKQKEDLAKI